MTELHYHWHWDLKASPEALWPWISDTNRFNRESGVPPVHTLSQSTYRRRLRLKRFGVAVDWDEEPFEWVRPQRFGVVRRYHGGPLAEMRVLAEIRPLDSGCRLDYQVWARPRNLLGRAAVRAQMLLSARNFSRTVRRYDRLLASQSSLLTVAEGDVRLSTGGALRLTHAARKLSDDGLEPRIVESLVTHLSAAGDLSVNAIRPYELADLWQQDRAKVLDAFLRGTRAGLLEFRWELLCPMCRGAKQIASTLSAIETTVHCDACNIDVTANFESAVELRFRPNPSIRQLRVAEYCVGGPQVTPHIVLQQLLPAGASRALEIPLEPGMYRLRAWGRPGFLPLQAAASGASSLSINCEPGEWRGESRVSLCPRLEFRNPTSETCLLILERSTWSDQAVTAADLSILPLFRDLFAAETLRPGQNLSIGGKAVLFTDLRNSTRMYREIGDAPAFGQVIRHFDVLRAVVEHHQGIVVKTIGDGVMAIFRTPLSALLAARDAQQQLAEADPPLTLKAGLHFGALIAVTLNDRLDFFGTTVNLAARLADLSRGMDIAVSGSILEDPEVSALLADDSGAPRLRVEPLDAVMKGFEDSPFRVFRLNPNDSRPTA